MKRTATVERLMTTEEAATVLGVSKRALERLRNAGRGPTHTYVGRFPRYSRKHINEYLSARAKAPR